MNTPALRCPVFPHVSKQTSRFRKKLLVALLASGFAATAQANPSGAAVVAGQAAISQVGKTLTVTNTPGAIINWQSFNINRDELTRFVQQNAQSAVLNRVTGGDASQILGALQSNGRVLLVNPNGVMIGRDARIDVSGLLVSTLNIKDADFMAGKYAFGNTPGAGRIENAGQIRTASGGQVILIAPQIENSGLIQAPEGQILLAAGQSVSLVDPDKPNIQVEVTNRTQKAVNLGTLIAKEVSIYGGLVKNSGVIQATTVQRGSNGKIVLRGRYEAENTGTLQANGEQGGDILIQADEGVSTVKGTVEALSTLNTVAVSTVNLPEVQKTAPQIGKGGRIEILAPEIVVDAVVDASGPLGGGAIFVGGEYQGGANPLPERWAVNSALGRGMLTGVSPFRDMPVVPEPPEPTSPLNGGESNTPALPNRLPTARTVTVTSNSRLRSDATETGEGGLIVVWSDGQTNAWGQFSALGGAGGGDGGLIETSGAHVSLTGIRVSTLAGKGKTGTWLIDPHDFTIGQTAGVGVDITAEDLESQLGDNDVTIMSSAGAGGTAGDINVNADVSWSSHTLTLKAVRNINLNATLTVSGTAGLTLRPSTANGSDSAVSSGDLVIGFDSAGAFKGRVNFNSSGPLALLQIAGQTYTVINTLEQLQAVNGTGYFALGSDIDASATATWNSAQGFVPLSQLNGRFDGLGHTIIGLTINRPGMSYVGLFSKIGGGSLIRHVGLVGGSVTGATFVGPISGFVTSTATVSRSFAQLDATATNFFSNGLSQNDSSLGGLVGYNAGTLSETYATGNVSGVGVVGGLVGSNFGGVYWSFATGNVHASHPTYGIAGGLVGTNWHYGGAIDIAYSYARGDVSGFSNVGGFCGWNGGSISNAFATGNVSHTGNGGGHSGGFVGYHRFSTLTNVYATGNVYTPGAGEVGALVGRWDGGPTTNAYGTGTVTAATVTTRGYLPIGSAGLFNGFDFTNVWQTDADSGLPVLRNLPLQVLTNTWTGAADSTPADGALWSVGGNWSLGHAPRSNEQVVIPALSNTDFIVFSGSGEVRSLVSAEWFKIENSGSALTLANSGTFNNGLSMAAGTSLTVNSGILSISSTNASMVINGTITARAGIHLNNENSNLTQTSGAWITDSLTLNGASSRYYLDGQNQIASLGGIVNVLSLTNTVDLTLTQKLPDGGLIAEHALRATGADSFLAIRNAGNLTIAGHVEVDGNISLYAGWDTRVDHDGFLSAAKGITFDTEAFGGDITLAANAGGSIDLVASGKIDDGWRAEPVNKRGAEIRSSGGSISISSGLSGVAGSGDINLKNILTEGRTSAGSSALNAGNIALYASNGNINLNEVGTYAEANVDELGAGGTVTISRLISSGLPNTPQATISVAHLDVSGVEVSGDYGSAGSASISVSGADKTLLRLGNVLAYGGTNGNQEGAFTVDAPNALKISTATGFSEINVGSDFTATVTGSNSALEIDAPLSWGTTLSLDAGYVQINNVLTGVGAAALQFANSDVRMGFNPDGSFKGRVDFDDDPHATLTVAGQHYALIRDLDGLQGMSGDVSGRYALVNDVQGGRFAPVGTAYTGEFSGRFEGLGHTISDLDIRTSMYGAGLFGSTTSDARVQNVGLLNASVSVDVGSDSSLAYLGALVGFNQGIVRNSFATGTVSGAEYSWGAGGLVGANIGTIDNSHAHVAVTAYSQVGGLVGYNNGTITDSFATGNVSGQGLSYYVGGLVGNNDGTISGSRASGAVTGHENVGGVTGYSYGTVSNSYYDADTVFINGAHHLTAGGIYSSQYQDWERGGYAPLSASNYLTLADGYYAISNLSDLKNGLAFFGQDNAAKYKLLANLDLSSLSGFYIPEFRGAEFNGNGHVIANLTVNQSFNGQIGFVGWLRGGEVKSLTLDQVNLMGGAWAVGGVVGYNEGTVSDSHVSGSVMGTSGVGGLVGDNGGAIRGSSSTATVVGTEFLGGLVGDNYGTLSNSYYDLESVLINGRPLLRAGGLYSGQYQAWVQGGYAPLSLANYSADLPLVEGYYQISSLEGLKKGLAFFGQANSAKYKLVADLDLSPLSGFYIPEFRGAEFNGNGHVISNLTVNQPLNNKIGFIGWLDNGEVKSLGLSQVAVTGGYSVGGLVGWNLARISDSYVSGTVSGLSEVGGLVGGNSNIGTLSRSYMTGTVSGEISVGGLVGHNSGSIDESFTSAAVTGRYAVGGMAGGNSGAILNSYATGAVAATENYTGGLVGMNFGTVSHSYATGAVSGLDNVGGLVGYNWSPGPGQGVVDGYWNTETSGQPSSAGGVGLTTAQFAQAANFAGFDFDTVWQMDSTSARPALRHTTLWPDPIVVPPAPPVTPAPTPEPTPTPTPTPIQQTVNRGEVLTISGDVDLHGGTLRIVAGAKLGGTGKILGNVVIDSGGTLAPGNSPGALTIVGDLTLSPTGTLLIELGGTSLSLFDRLTVTGTANLAGALSVVSYNGYQPAAGTGYAFLNFAATTGSFSSFMKPTLWDMSLSASSTSLSALMASTQTSVVVQQVAAKSVDLALAAVPTSGTTVSNAVVTTQVAAVEKQPEQAPERQSNREESKKKQEEEQGVCN